LQPDELQDKKKYGLKRIRTGFRLKYKKLFGIRKMADIKGKQKIPKGIK
jgi:hypothetical protein